MAQKFSKIALTVNPLDPFYALQAATDRKCGKNETNTAERPLSLQNQCLSA
jgi:hypothetical protein